MERNEIEDALRELQARGEINEIIDLEKGERGNFSLTEKGRENAKELLKTNPEALATIVQLAWNTLIDQVKDEKDDIEKVFIVLRHVEAWDKMELGMPFEDVVMGLGIPHKYHAAKRGEPDGK